MPPSCTYTYCETFFFSKPSAIKTVDFIVYTHFYCQRISVRNSKITANQQLQYTYTVIYPFIINYNTSVYRLDSINDNLNIIMHNNKTHYYCIKI